MAVQRLGATLATTLIVASGCTHDSPGTPSAPEDKVQTTNRWITHPGLDLMSPEGTFLRAITESFWRIQSSTQVLATAVAEKGYPGVAHAGNEVLQQHAVGGASISSLVSVGTEYLEVIDFRRDGDRYTGTVCSEISLTAGKTSDGTYTSGGRALPGGTGLAFTYGPDPALPPAAQRSPLANQRGPSNKPSDNVFGTWLLFDMPRMSDDQINKCHSTLAPGTPTDWPDGTYTRPDPPPTLPPDPGWPEGSSA